MATMYTNRHRNPLIIGGRVVKPGGTFTDDEATAASINVRALVKSGAVVAKPKAKPKTTKRKGGK